jgi:hypothetical protein
MTDEPIEGTATEEQVPPRREPWEEEFAVVPARVTQEVLHPLDAAEVKAAMDTYQTGLRAILDDEDWQGRPYAKGSFVKKSGWRKVATWFNLTVHYVSERVDRDESGEPLRARVWVRAVAPNGRAMDGDGACARGESRFAREQGRAKLENDLLGTATTRAKNRAISDLVGMGAVSAEETDAHAGQHPFGAPYNENRRATVLRALALLAGPGGDPVKLGGRIVKRSSGYMPAVVADTITILAGAVQPWAEDLQASESPLHHSEDPDGQGGEDPLPASPPEPSPADDGWGPDDG